jgi:hypothetical protein
MFSKLRMFGVRPALTLGLVVAAMGVPSPPASAADGAYYVFRTRDTTQPPTAEQTKACNAYFGLRAPTVITRLNAALYAFRADAPTGRIVDQTAAPLGPGFICGAPAAPSGLEAYAYTALPTTGRVEARGPCGLQPGLAQLGALIVNCHIQPTPGQPGIDGGLITSNSVVNQVEVTEGAPTGSVWTAYVVGQPPRPAQSSPVPGAPTGAEAPGIDFYVARAGDERAGTGDCRRSDLSSVQPDPETSRVPDRAGPVVGTLELCGSTPTTAVARLTARDGAFDVRASGECTSNATAIGRIRSCALTVGSSSASSVRGGLLTSNGAIWTIALFGAPPPAASPPAHAPAQDARRPRPGRVVLRVARRTRSRVLTARWRSGSATTYDVQTGRRGRRQITWKRQRRGITRSSLRFRVGPPGIAAIRVRARLDGRAGPWTTKTIRVLRHTRR